MLCDTESSVLRLEDSEKIDVEITPDAAINKQKASLNSEKRKAAYQRKSYNRGTFMQVSHDRLVEDFPPQLSESARSKMTKKKGEGSQETHSDDEVEVRRGLESENVRSDMGSNPELLRQSTHSLLHKQ